MSVKTMIGYRQPDFILDSNMRNVFFSHREYIRNHKSTKVHPVNVTKAVAFNYNLFLYLEAEGYDRSTHWLIMIINGMSNPDEFDSRRTSLLIPGLVIIDEINALIG